MKFGFSSLVLGILFLVSEVGFADCDTGRQAFETTVYPVIRQSCVGCHGGSGPGPGFATNRVQDSYFQIRNYVDFSNVAGSYFIYRAGNGHCGNCGMTAERMTDLVSSWWSQGENQCTVDGSNFYTTEKEIPEFLPSREQGFYRMEWDLGGIRASLRGSVFSIEVQKFAEGSDNAPGAYRFRSPRISRSEHTLHISDIRLYVNHHREPLANAYESVNAVVSPQGVLSSNPNLPAVPHPVLSSDGMIVVQQNISRSDRISIGFGAITIADPVPCVAVDVFEQTVLPILERRSCFSCHGGGADSSPGIFPANTMFNMNLDTTGLCQSFLERVNRTEPSNSVIVNYPFGGVTTHPQIFTQTDVLSARRIWQNWMSQEISSPLIERTGL